MHRALLDAVLANAVDLVFCCGPLMQTLWQALPASRRGGYAENSAALETQVLPAIRAGDAVMVKGSLGSRMAPIVKALQRAYPHRDPTKIPSKAPSPARPHKVDAMLYWLVDLSDKLSVLNVFRYITFRTGGAIITALMFVFLFGQTIIDRLRLLQGKGQPIRADGPKSHLIAKAGTPTMGGLMILSGMLVSTLLWANPANPYVWVVLWVTLGFGLVGFYDDYLKVTKQQATNGFAGRTRLSVEAVIAGSPVSRWSSSARGRFRPRWCFRFSRNWRSISAGSLSEQP